MYFPLNFYKSEGDIIFIMPIYLLLGWGNQGLVSFIPMNGILNNQLELKFNQI